MVEKNDGAGSGAPAKKNTAAPAKAPTKAAAKAPAKAVSAASATTPVVKKAGTVKPATTAPATSASASKKAASTATKTTKSAPQPTENAEVTKREHVLKVHHLRPAPGSKKPRTRVGRGEGSKGKTAGRGTKGTKARYQVRPGFEGGNLNSVMRAPKLRGFTNPFRVEYQVVNLEKLAELYPSGGEVTVGDLVGKGVVRKNEKVKVLGSGDIAVKLNVAVDKVSGSAERKIVAAGGSIQ